MLFHLVFPKGPIDFSSVNLHPHWWQDYISDGYLWYGIIVKNSSTRIWEVVWRHLGVNLIVISLSGELMKPVFRLTWILKFTLSSWLINICVVLINQLQLLTFWAYLLTQILHFESLNNLRCVWDQFWLNEIHRQWLIEYRITSSAWIAWNMVYFHSMPWTTLLWEPPWLPRGRVPALQTFAPGRTWITTGCTKSCCRVPVWQLPSLCTIMVLVSTCMTRPTWVHDQMEGSQMDLLTCACNENSSWGFRQRKNTLDGASASARAENFEDLGIAPHTLMSTFLLGKPGHF